MEGELLRRAGRIKSSLTQKCCPRPITSSHLLASARQDASQRGFLGFCSLANKFLPLIRRPRLVAVAAVATAAVAASWELNFLLTAAAGGACGANLRERLVVVPQAPRPSGEYSEHCRFQFVSHLKLRQQSAGQNNLARSLSLPRFVCFIRVLYFVTDL